MSFAPRSSVDRIFGSEEPRVFTPPLRRLTPRTSLGFQCIEFAEQVLELELYPWQKWLLIHALELLEDGTFRFRTVVVLVARQNGKSTLMQVLSLWRMFVHGAPLVIGTAQNLDIAEEVWAGAVEMAKEVPELEAEIDKVDLTNGKKALRLVSGSRYKVQAATRRGGRGLTGDLILLDELREHQNWDAWGAVTKTTRTRALAQIWAASNAGDRSSVVLKHLRMLAHLALGDPDGLHGDEPASADELSDLNDSLGLFEWSAPPGCDVRDRQGWAAANPTMGHIPSMERSIAGDVATDLEAVFRTEVLCQWVDSVRETAFPPGVWEANQVEGDRITSTPTFAVDVRTGLHQSFAVVAAGSTDQGHDLIAVPYYELGDGKQWSDDYIVAKTCDVLGSRGVERIVVDKYGANAHLIPLFEERGIEVLQFDSTDMRNGCVALTDALVNGRVKHLGEEALTVAVLGAGKRVTESGFTWSHAKSLTDIAPLRAATAAWWAHRSLADFSGDPLDSLY